uniref:Uncharacterized protein n=1 Tax=Kalanchoe fedtschenkoi TaxID=63787 RepID=A0A7N0TAH3_KALFE
MACDDDVSMDSTCSRYGYISPKTSMHRRTYSTLSLKMPKHISSPLHIILKCNFRIRSISMKLTRNKSRFTDKIKECAVSDQNKRS